MSYTQIYILIWAVLIENNLPVDNKTHSLLLETCAVESKLGKYRRQIKGPAKGIMQIEPFTYKDITENYLPYTDSTIRKSVENLIKKDRNIETNDSLSIALARIVYMRNPVRIPETLIERAHYWKLFYNTKKGKGTVDDYIESAYKLIYSKRNSVSLELKKNK